MSNPHADNKRNTLDPMYHLGNHEVLITWVCDGDTVSYCRYDGSYDNTEDVYFFLLNDSDSYIQDRLNRGKRIVGAYTIVQVFHWYKKLVKRAQDQRTYSGHKIRSNADALVVDWRALCCWADESGFVVDDVQESTKYDDGHRDYLVYYHIPGLRPSHESTIYSE